MADNVVTGSNIAQSKEHFETEDATVKCKRWCSRLGPADDCTGGKPALTNDSPESHYFRSYVDIAVHRVMVGDFIRTHTYRKAILSNYRLFHRKVVADVGAGTGAKKVYAIEASDIAEQAKKVVCANGLQDKITVIQSRVEDVKLPEKVDVVVSEWMGYMLLYESMLPSVLFARENLLQKGGIMLPSKVNLYIAPLSDSEEWEDRIEFWSKVTDLHKVDMSTVKEEATRQLFHNIVVKTVWPESIQSHAALLTSLDLSTVTAEDLKCVQGQFEVSCFGHCNIHGFVIWFTAEFPQNIVLSTSPYENATHWEQSVMYIPAVSVEQDTIIKGSVTFKPSPQYYRFLDVHLEYEIDKMAQSFCYHMTN